MSATTIAVISILYLLLHWLAWQLVSFCKPANCVRMCCKRPVQHILKLLEWLLIIRSW